MSDHPVPVPSLPLADRLIAAARSVLSSHEFESWGETNELYVVVQVTPEGDGPGEVTPQDAEREGIEAEPGDELLLRLGRVNGTTWSMDEKHASTWAFIDIEMELLPALQTALDAELAKDHSTG